MRRAHKLLSLLLVLTLALSLGAPVGAAYSDTSGHWAEDSIDRWSAEGVLNGKGGGGFDPDGSMTRAEFAQMLCNMMGYTEKAENGFTDVPEGEWYADAMLKLVAAGVINGVSDNLAAPNALITREQAAVMLCRAFSIKTGGPAEMAFVDAGDVAPWARDSVAALADMGMINGMGGNNVAPKLDINRASVAKLVDNMVSEYVTGDKTISGEVRGVVIVAGDAKVTFKDATVNAPILVAPSAGGAKVELSGTTSAENVVVAAEKAAVTVGGSAAAESVTAAAPHAEVKVEGKVETVAVGGEGAKVDVSGAVGTVSTDAANTTVAVSGTVDKVDVAAGADKTEISTTGSAKIDSVTTSAEDVKVSGSGSVGAVISGGGSANVTTKGTEVKNEGSGNVTAGGKPVEPGGSATSSGGSSSGGGSSGGGGGSTHTHSWSEGTVTTAATCTAAGVKTFTCSCGETKTEPIDMLGHTQAAAYSSDATGHWHACTVCGEAADKTAHDYGAVTDCSLGATCGVCGYEKTGGEHVALDAGTVTTAATCTEAGVKTYRCSACNGSTTEVIPATGHTEVVDAAVAATCTEAGKTEGKHCSVCNTVTLAQTEVPATGHSYGGWEEADSANHKRVCANDASHVETEAHNWSGSACTDCGAIKTVTDEAGLREALSNGGEVILGADIVLTGVEGDDAVLYVDKPATLVLNGHTLKGSICAGSELTIDGTVEGSTISKGEDDYSVIESFGGQVTINGGTYNGDISADGEGEVNIYGGTYNGSMYAHIPTNAAPMQGEIGIYGGTFTGPFDGYVGVVGGTFYFDPTGFVYVENLTVTDNGDGTWTVTEKSTTD